jgi:hypothetical protein
MSSESVTQVLESVLAQLREEFPYAVVYDARLEFRLGERSDLGDPTQRWNETIWTIQVDNLSESADSLEQAFADLRATLARRAQVPERAERLAALLREIPDEGFERENVVMAARAILEKERGRR